MHKLFYLSFVRTLQRLGTSQLNIAEIDQILINNKIKNSGQDMLYRLPRQQLRHIANIPCPINSLQQNNAAQIIRASKHLRNHCKYDEKKICYKCPFVASCPSAKKQLQSYTYDNTLKDLLVYFYGLQNYLSPDTIYYRQWVSAYKLGDSVIAAIQDLSKEGAQIKEYQKIRVLAIQQYKLRTQTNEEPQDKDEKSTKKKVKKLEQILEKQLKVQKSTISSTQTNNNTKSTSSNEAPKIKQVYGKDFSFDEQQQFEPVQKFSKESIQKKENATLNQGESSQIKKVRQQKKKQPRDQSQKSIDERQQKPKLRKIQIQNITDSPLDKSSKKQKMSNYYGSQKDVEDRLNKFKGKYSDRSGQYTERKQYSRNKYSQNRQGGQYQKKDRDYDPRNKYSNNNDQAPYNKGYSKNKYSDRSSIGGQSQNNRGYNNNNSGNYRNNKYNNNDQKRGGNDYNSGNGYKNKYNNRDRDQQNSFKPRYNKYNQRNEEDGQEEYKPRIKNVNRGDYVNQNSYNKNDRIDKKNDDKNPFVTKWNDQKSDRFNKGNKNAYDDGYVSNKKASSDQLKFNKQQFEQIIKKSKAEPKMVDIQKIQEQVQAPRAGRKVTRRRSSSSNNDQL